MSLFDWQDLLDNYQFFFFIDLKKNGIPSGNMQPLDDSPPFKTRLSMWLLVVVIMLVLVEVFLTD